VIGQPRATQRYERQQADDEEQLRKQIVDLASKYGHYGYRRVTALLQEAGWQVNRKTGGADLVPGRAESALKAAQTRSIVVE